MTSLPRKKEGEVLGAGHVNQLSEAAEKVLRPGGASYNNASSGLIPFVLRSVIITSRGCDDTSDQDSDGECDYFTIKFRYFDSITGEWKTDARGGGYALDTLGVEGSFAVGDTLQAYYDNQRGAFVPIGSSAGGRREAVISSTLSAPASTLVAPTSCSIYFIVRNDDDTSSLNPDIDEAFNADPDLTASSGTYCRVERFSGKWFIYYLGCAPQDALLDAIAEIEDSV